MEILPELLRGWEKVSLDSSRARLQRFDRYFRLQHILMFVSVIILVITAIPLWCLRYPFAVFTAGVKERNYYP